MSTDDDDVVVIETISLRSSSLSDFKKYSPDAEKVIPQRKTLKKWTYDVLFHTYDRTGLVFDIVLLLLIVTSVILICLETVKEYEHMLEVYIIIDEILLGIFIVEYILRIWSSPNRKEYIFSAFGIVDILSIVPATIHFSGFYDDHAVSMIRALRLFRVFRILNLDIYAKEANEFKQAFVESRRKILIFVLALFLVCIMFAAMMYAVDPSLESLPIAIYFAIVTLTTTGFGDLAPENGWSKAIASLSMLVGFGILSLPTGFTVARALKAKQSCSNCDFKVRRIFNFCPRCGKRLFRKARKASLIPSDFLSSSSSSSENSTDSELTYPLTAM
ncbi:hypothetical protein PCE1_003877 [Barthelona sp. PCE]